MSLKENVKKVEDVRTFVNGKSRMSARKSAPLFDISTTTYWKILKKELHMRFYLDKAVHPRTEAHKQQRLKFCRWLLDQPEPETFMLKVICTDENQAPVGKMMTLRFLLDPMGLSNLTIEMIRL